MSLPERIERGIVFACKVVAAALVFVEIGILFAGVVWRYLLDSPLVWSGELAEMMFLWLVSFGAVIALGQNEHMRMSVLLSRRAPSTRAVFKRISALATVVFTVGLIVPGIGYIRQQQTVTIPTLGIPESWEVAGELIALIILLFIALRQLFEQATLRELVIAFTVGLVIGVGLWLLEPLLYAIGNADLVIFFVVFVGACIVSGIPIAFSFGIATLGYLFYTSTIPLSVVVIQMNQGMSAIVLLAVPMFVVLGLLLEMTGIAGALVNCLSALVGHRRGGLSYSLVGTMFLISGISGSKAADEAAIAPILLPEMKRRGVPDGEVVAQLASSAAMGEIIPPSLVMIITGAVTGVSISALFTAGLLPAAVATVALIVLIFIRTRHDRPFDGRVGAVRTLRLFVVAIPALILPFVIRYSVLAGITTATEVATVGVIYSVLVGIAVYRCFDWRRIFPIFVETASLSGAILLIIGTASAMAWALTQAGFAGTLAAMMEHLPGGKIGFMAASILLFIILGSVLEGVPALVLFGPLLFPIAQQVGVNVIHYAIVVILAMAIGFFSPPVGVGFYQTCLIGKASSDELLGPIVPYMVALVIALVVVAAVPWLSTGFLH